MHAPFLIFQDHLKINLHIYESSSICMQLAITKIYSSYNVRVCVQIQISYVSLIFCHTQRDKTKSLLLKSSSSSPIVIHAICKLRGSRERENNNSKLQRGRVGSTMLHKAKGMHERDFEHLPKSKIMWLGVSNTFIFFGVWSLDHTTAVQYN